jgi:hypothetical protein
MTGTIENRKLKLAYQRAIRIGYDDLADELRPKIKPKEGLQKSEVRFLRDMLIREFDNVSEGCQMAELMDGSGELGGAIWEGAEDQAISQFMHKAGEYGYFPREIMQARDQWIEWEHQNPHGPSDLYWNDKHLLDYYDAHDLWEIYPDGDKGRIKSHWTEMRESGMLVTINEDEL